MERRKTTKKNSLMNAIFRNVRRCLQSTWALTLEKRYSKLLLCFLPGSHCLEPVSTMTARRIRLHPQSLEFLMLKAVFCTTEVAQNGYLTQGIFYAICVSRLLWMIRFVSASTWNKLSIGVIDAESDMQPHDSHCGTRHLTMADRSQMFSIALILHSLFP